MDPTGDYADSTRRLVASQHRWAILVHLAVFVSVLPNREHAAYAAGAVAVVIPFNVVLARFSARMPMALMEGLRAAGNFAIGAYVYHRIGWPPAAFMWLPFTSLASDGANPRLAYALLAFHAIGYSVLPCLDGVPWVRPLAWVCIALLSRVFVDQRVRLTRDMWLASEAQRRAVSIVNVVSDMRMPLMNGAELLERVAVRSPETARIVMSGHAELDANEGFAHEALGKPCSRDDIIASIERVVAVLRAA